MPPNEILFRKGVGNGSETRGLSPNPKRRHRILFPSHCPPRWAENRSDRESYDIDGPTLYHAHTAGDHYRRAHMLNDSDLETGLSRRRFLGINAYPHAVTEQKQVSQETVHREIS